VPFFVFVEIARVVGVQRVLNRFIARSIHLRLSVLPRVGADKRRVLHPF
jgi:hypothetical protein